MPALPPLLLATPTRLPSSSDQPRSPSFPAHPLPPPRRELQRLASRPPLYARHLLPISPAPLASRLALFLLVAASSSVSCRPPRPLHISRHPPTSPSSSNHSSHCVASSGRPCSAAAGGPSPRCPPRPLSSISCSLPRSPATHPASPSSHLVSHLPPASTASPASPATASPASGRPRLPTSLQSPSSLLLIALLTNQLLQSPLFRCYRRPLASSPFLPSLQHLGSPFSPSSQSSRIALSASCVALSTSRVAL